MGEIGPWNSAKYVPWPKSLGSYVRDNEISLEKEMVLSSSTYLQGSIRDKLLTLDAFFFFWVVIADQKSSVKGFTKWTVVRDSRKNLEIFLKGQNLE